MNRGGGAAALVLVFEDGQGFMVKKDEFLRQRGQSGT